METESFFELKKENNEVEKLRYNVVLNDSHVIFKAHFPSFAILPGSCINNIVRSAIEIELGTVMQLKNITSMKFTTPILLDEKKQYTLLFTLKEIDECYMAKGTISNGNTIYCKFDLSLIKRQNG